MPKWLTCKINKGMFSDEFNVIVTTLNGEDVSVFVPKDFTDEGNRRVRVQVIEAGKRGRCYSAG